MRKSGTYFEQIPLEVVKKIAGEDVFKRDKPGTGTVIVEPASRKRNRAPARALDRKER